MNVTTHTANQPQPAGSTMVLTHKFFRLAMGMGFGLIIVLGFLYLVLLNSFSKRSFELDQIRTRSAQIQAELEEADIAIAIPSSLYALASSEQIQEMPELQRWVNLRVRNGQVVRSENLTQTYNSANTL